MAVLQEIGGAESVYTFELKGNSIVIGRDDHCDLVIRSPAVSRMHAKIESEGGRFYVHDLNSRNGTSLNGYRIFERELLRNGDIIDFSNNKFAFLNQSSLDDESESGGSFRAGPTVVQDSENQDSSIYREIVKSGDLIPNDVANDENVRSSRVSFQVSMQPEKAVPIVTFEAAKKLQAILHVVRGLRGVGQLEQFFSRVVQILFAEFASSEHITIVHTQETVDGFRVLQAASRNRNDFNYLCVPLIRYTATTRQAVLYTDEWNLSTNSPPRIHDLSHRFLMCLPLLSTDNGCVAVIQLETSRKDRAFQASDLECLAILGHIFSLSLQMLANAYQVTTTPSVTAAPHDALLSLSAEIASTRSTFGRLLIRSYKPTPPAGIDAITGYQVMSDGRRLITMLNLQEPQANLSQVLDEFIQHLDSELSAARSLKEATQSGSRRSIGSLASGNKIISVAVLMFDHDQTNGVLFSAGDCSIYCHSISESRAIPENATPLNSSLCRYSPSDSESTVQLNAGDSLILLNGPFMERFLENCDSDHEETLTELLRRSLINPLNFNRVFEDFLDAITSNSSQNAAVAFALVHQLPENAVVAAECGPKGLTVE